MPLLLLLLLLGSRLGVVHRDIKPENFLLGAPTLLSAPAGTAASVLKISDFGVSAFFQPGEVSSSSSTTTFSLLHSEYCHDFFCALCVLYLLQAYSLAVCANAASIFPRQITQGCF